LATPEKEEGHDQQTTVDPFEISSDEFAAKLAEAGSGADGAEDAPEGTNDTPTGENASEEKQDPPGDTGQEKSDPPPLELDDDPKPPAADDDPDKGGAAETIAIVHNGQVHTLTKEKAIQLAQKGFDYDTKIGPYQKMIKLIEADPDARKMLSDHFMQKAGGDNPGGKDALKPISEYEDERDWLRDNVNHLMQGQNPTAPEGGATPPADDPIAKIETDLKMRDPDNYVQVMQRMPEFSKKLSVEQYQRVNTDFKALCKFYDYVKDNVLGPPAPKEDAPEPPPTPSGASEDAPFRMRSGSQSPPAETPKGENLAWDLPNDKFNAVLNKAKGLA